MRSLSKEAPIKQKTTAIWNPIRGAVAFVIGETSLCFFIVIRWP